VVYVVDPTRSSQVPKNHFQDVEVGFLSVDRYSAYKAFVKDLQIILVFCWAHVRRDFLDVAKGWPGLEQWAMDWVDEIGGLYHLNKQRLLIQEDPQQFEQKDEQLRIAVQQMADKKDKQLKDEELHPACEKVLQSLDNHWDGLTVFVDHPQIPMDNNTAEQALRGGVVGRKNFYGSGSVWSAALSAVLFTIIQTLLLWNINPRQWFQAYLEACARNSGNPAQNISSFLPWNMSDEQKKIYAFEPEVDDSS
jgi:transposase